MLNGWGFKEVYNLAGGIKAFQGHKATGPVELNLDLVKGDETPAAIITLAYGMEKALQLFYETLQQQSPDQELQALFGKLAQVEVHHEQRLFEVYGRVAPGGQDLAGFESTIVPQTLEGGFSAVEFLKTNKSHLQTVPEVLDLAMMLETQALDLYLRFAGRCEQPQTREVLYALAGEEKAHLASLGRLLEEKSGLRG
jgi:rubrerythrin